MGAESKILFKAFLRRHNNKDVVPTLLAMQKMTAFYHNKGIDMLKLGCTLANLTIICLQKSTRPKFYPFTEGDKELLQKIGEDVVVGPSIVFTPRMSLIKISLGVCILCANQLLVLMRVNCFSTQGVNLWQQDFTHVGILPQWSTYLYRHRKKSAASKFWWCPTSNAWDVFGKLKIYTQQVDRKKLIASLLMSFSPIPALSLKLWDAFITLPSLEIQPFLTEEDIQHSIEKKELDEMRLSYLKEIGFTVVEIWECEWERLHKTDTSVKEPKTILGTRMIIFDFGTLIIISKNWYPTFEMKIVNKKEAKSFKLYPLYEKKLISLLLLP